MNKPSKPPKSDSGLDQLADDSVDAPSRTAWWFVWSMVCVAVICVGIGAVRHGFNWTNFWGSVGCLVTGIVCVAIGLLEIEWLERLFWLGEIISGSVGLLLWGSWKDSLSDSELLGRPGATFVWLLFGLPTFVFGCVWALRIMKI